MTPQNPTHDPQQKARAIYLQILLALGGRLGSRTGMWKAFWAAHLIHMEAHGAELSNWTILRWKHGPGPEHPYDIEAALEVRGLLHVDEQYSAGYKFVTLNLIDQASAAGVVADDLSDDEQASVKKAAEWQAHMYARELSDFTHENSIAWRTAPMKAPMEIYVDLLKEEPLGKLTDSDQDRLQSERVHRGAAEEYLQALFGE